MVTEKWLNILYCSGLLFNVYLVCLVKAMRKMERLHTGHLPVCLYFWSMQFKMNTFWIPYFCSSIVTLEQVIPQRDSSLALGAPQHLPRLFCSPGCQSSECDNTFFCLSFLSTQMTRAERTSLSWANTTLWGPLMALMILKADWETFQSLNSEGLSASFLDSSVSLSWLCTFEEL